MKIYIYEIENGLATATTIEDKTKKPIYVVDNITQATNILKKYINANYIYNTIQNLEPEYIDELRKQEKKVEINTVVRIKATHKVIYIKDIKESPSKYGIYLYTSNDNHYYRRRDFDILY